jgi:prepilin-type N-terminal cleavage/methylation domain-containing protein/prepilin-type processing-associated H-X9-DG protein
MEDTPHPSPRINRTSSGFTLVELLTVIAVLAVLVAILFPVVGGLVEKARLTQCQSNLRQIAAGVHGYIADNSGKYPLARSYTEPGTGWEGPFWTDQIEPYTDSESAQRLKHQGRTGESIFYCPSSPLHHGISDYGINPNVVIHPDGNNARGLPAAKVRDPARTVLAADSGRIWPASGQLIGGWRITDGWIQSPPDDPFEGNGPLPRHGDLLNVLFCDGRVEAMTYDQVLELHPEAFEI